MAKRTITTVVDQEPEADQGAVAIAAPPPQPAPTLPAAERLKTYRQLRKEEALSYLRRIAIDGLPAGESAAEDLDELLLRTGTTIDQLDGYVAHVKKIRESLSAYPGWAARRMQAIRARGLEMTIKVSVAAEVERMTREYLHALAVERSGLEQQALAGQQAQDFLERLQRDADVWLPLVLETDGSNFNPEVMPSPGSVPAIGDAQKSHDEAAAALAAAIADQAQQRKKLDLCLATALLRAQESADLLKRARQEEDRRRFAPLVAARQEFADATRAVDDALQSCGYGGAEAQAAVQKKNPELFVRRDRAAAAVDAAEATMKTK